MLSKCFSFQTPSFSNLKLSVEWNFAQIPNILWSIKHFTAYQNFFLLFLLARHARSLYILHCIFGLFTATQTTEAEKSRARSWRGVGLVFVWLKRIHFLFSAATGAAAGCPQSWTARFTALETVHTTPAAFFLVPHRRRLLHRSVFLCCNEKAIRNELKKVFVRNLRSWKENN